MSETQDQTAGADTKPKKAPVEVTTVKMSDGREVGFAGKRKMLKNPVEGEGGQVGVRFDFLNGETRTVMISPSDKLFGRFAQHGLSQKIGDETAGDDKVEDCVLHVDAIIERLGKDEWGVERSGAGDGFSGASDELAPPPAATGVTPGAANVASLRIFFPTFLAANCGSFCGLLGTSTSSAS